jgi:phosphatidylserine decarboxylase
LIKFGSRVDVLLDRDATVQVKPGDRVKGGASVLALLPVAPVGEAVLSGQREAH